VGLLDDAALAQDRSLLFRMSGGDAEALRELYARYAVRLHGVALRIVGNREEARDAVQDTFLKAWRQAGRYRPERAEVFAWLVFIARNSAIDRLRRQKRDPASVAMSPEDLSASLLAPSAKEAAEQQEWLAHHLSHLNPAQREALELAFFTGCTQQEIADRMRTPVGNVKNHLRRGLLKLRQLALP
jgi:RNA polymerase sigma-70 factor (ECF subfamily)